MNDLMQLSAMCGLLYHIAELEAQLDQAAGVIADRNEELKQWMTWGIVEIAARNPNVRSYVEHWEGRAKAAEAEAAARLQMYTGASLRADMAERALKELKNESSNESSSATDNS